MNRLIETALGSGGRTSAHDRGATAILVSLSMVVVLSFAALTIDYGAMSGRQAKLQNAADAAALAIGRECATLPTSCTALRANQLIAEMKAGNDADGTLLRRGLIGSAVTRTQVRGSDDVPLNFARIMGYENSTVGANATVDWSRVSTGTNTPGGPGGGGNGDEVFLPLAIPACTAIAARTANFPTTRQLIQTDLHSDSQSVASLLSSRSCTMNGQTYNSPTRAIWMSGLLGLGNAHVGGDAIINIDAGVCKYAYNASAIYSTLPITGSLNSLATPPACLNKIQRVAASRPTTYVFPVYESVGGTVGTLLNVRVVGFVKFKVTGLRLGGIAGASLPILFPTVEAQDSSAPKCDTRPTLLGIPVGLNYCNGIQGYFERGVVDGPGWKFAPPSNVLLNLGLVQVRLVPEGS